LASLLAQCLEQARMGSGPVPVKTILGATL
jgi:hypothetical protein